MAKPHRCCAVTCILASVLAVSPASAQTLVGSAPSQAPLFPTPVATHGPSRSAFSSLFKDTLTDFSRVPTKENLLVVALGGLATSVAHPFDNRVSRGLSSSPTAASAFRAGESIGSAAAQLAGAFATQAVGHVIGNARVAEIGSDLVRAQIVTQSMTAGIKLAVRRTRPDGTQFSFPSGHSSTAFATATVLQRNLGWKAGLPAYGLAAYVATSRVQVRRHYLSDVAMGAALGIVAGRSVTFGRGDARFAVTPSALPGGAGVNLTLVGRR